MNLGRCLAFTAALLLGAGPALAQHNGSGGYVGAGFGDFSLELDDIEDVDIDFDEDDDAVKIFGGWRFNPVIAAELDYIDFGNPSATVDGLDVDTELTGVAPYLVGTIPLGAVLELYARVGVIFYNLEITADGADTLTIDDSGEDLAYGAGAGLNLLQHLNLRAEFEVVDVTDLEKVEAAWLAAAWRF